MSARSGTEQRAAAQELERPNSAYLLVYDRLHSHETASTSSAAVPQVPRDFVRAACTSHSPCGVLRAGSTWAC